MLFVYKISSLCVIPPAANSQPQQLWLDYQLDYPFANVYLFEVSASYQTNVSENKWRTLSINPTFEWQSLQYLDVLVNLPVAYTLQTENYNSFGFDPSLGARVHLTQNRRVTSNIILKLEQRIFQNIETGDWDHSNRSRIKGEVLVSLNGPNLFQDKLWWAILDYEEFIVTDQQLEERYANRRRGRIGLGYRLNYGKRFELLYTWQSSRDEIEGDFISLDQVFQLRYKMFLNPAPTPTTKALNKDRL